MNKAIIHGLSPSRWSEDVLGIIPDPWQETVLDGSSKRMILNCARQTGKSTVTAILALHVALFRAPASVVIISPSLSQSSESLKKVKSFLALMKVKPAITKDNESRLEFSNGSRIIALPGSTVTSRGFSAVDLLVIDEASRVLDEIYFGVRPLVAVSNGRIIVLSTPFGKRGFFWHAWTDGGDGWERVLIPATDCPRITPEFLAEEKRSMGDWFYNQEYLCCFMEAEDGCFAYDLIMSAIDETVKPLFEEYEYE